MYTVLDEEVILSNTDISSIQQGPKEQMAMLQGLMQNFSSLKSDVGQVQSQLTPAMMRTRMQLTSRAVEGEYVCVCGGGHFFVV